MASDMLEGECNVCWNLVSVVLDGPDYVSMHYRRSDTLVAIRRFTEGNDVVAANDHVPGLHQVYNRHGIDVCKDSVESAEFGAICIFDYCR